MLSREDFGELNQLVKETKPINLESTKKIINAYTKMYKHLDEFRISEIEKANVFIAKKIEECDAARVAAEKVLFDLTKEHGMSKQETAEALNKLQSKIGEHTAYLESFNVDLDNTTFDYPESNFKYTGGNTTRHRFNTRKMKRRF